MGYILFKIFSYMRIIDTADVYPGRLTTQAQLVSALGAEVLEKVMIKWTSLKLLDTKSKNTHPSQVRAYDYGCLAHGLGHGSYTCEYWVQVRQKAD